MDRLDTVHIVIFRPNIAQCDAFFYIFIKTKSVAKEVSIETVHSLWDNVNSNMKYSEIFLCKIPDYDFNFEILLNTLHVCVNRYNNVTAI